MKKSEIKDGTFVICKGTVGIIENTQPGITGYCFDIYMPTIDTKRLREISESNSTKNRKVLTKRSARLLLTSELEKKTDKKHVIESFIKKHF